MAKKFLALLRENPAIASGLFSVALIVAARFGLNLDGSQVALVAAVLSGVLGVTVHALTVPSKPGDHDKT